jgi:heptosyltransferase II
MAAPPKRIVIFNVNWIGDVVFSTAVIRNLRYSFPDSFIACIIPPRCVPVLQGNPHLDEIIVFDEKGSHRGLTGLIAFCAELRKKRFDAAYLLHRSMKRALITVLAGIPERIGYRTRKRFFLLTKKISAPDLFSTHRAQYYLELLRRAGLAVRDCHADFAFGDGDRDAAVKLLSGFCGSREFLVGINPGGNWMPKRWPKDNFMLLVKRLAQEGVKTVITGGPEDAALGGEIEAAGAGCALSVCGKCGLKVFGALANRFDLFITADSGPLHIAAAAGAKHILALFGPTDPALTGPVQSARVTVLQKKPDACAIPCYVVDCRDNACMKALTVDAVLEQVHTIHAASQ